MTSKQELEECVSKLWEFAHANQDKLHIGRVRIGLSQIRGALKET